MPERLTMIKVATISKALSAALAAGLAAAVTAYPDGFTAQELGTIAGAVVVAGVGVYLAPANAKGPTR